MIVISLWMSNDMWNWEVKYVYGVVISHGSRYTNGAIAVKDAAIAYSAALKARYNENANT